MNFNIEKIAMSLLGCFLILASVFYAGYSKGKSTQKEQQNAAIVKQVGKVAEKETVTHVAVQTKGEDYEAKFKELEAKFVKLGYDFGRLRVKRPGGSLPEAGTAASKGDGTFAEKPVDRPGTSEINLDGIAAKVIGLGFELDQSNAKVAYLQGLLVTYHDACTIH